MTGETPPPVIPTPLPTENPSQELVRTISSRDLMQGQRELLIDHDGETYRLRVTRNGKLILNK
ncbi:hemin uptake protein HemP [bacterium]|nr:hemin uptake protein HemP [bacterium]